MPQIKPTSIQDLLKFIAENRPDIENGTYDILIEDAWVPQISEESAGFLVKHCPSSRDYFSRHPKTHSNVLAILAGDERLTIRQSVARNPSTPVDVLEFLAGDHDSNVRGAVAENKKTNAKILAILARDTGKYYAPHDLSQQYSHDNTLSIRAIVACHPNTPPEILEILARDVDHDVLVAVAANPQTPTQLWVDLLKRFPNLYSWSVVSSIPRRPEVMEIFAKDNNEKIRWVAAESCYSPMEALESLAKDHEYSVRVRIAANPNTPSHVRRALKWDSNKVVREAAGAACFIATAVYGSEMAPEVIVFRNYRDQVLTRYWSGKIFIKVYYALSPRIAWSISNMPKIKAVIRCFVLDPLAQIIRRKYPS